MVLQISWVVITLVGVLALAVYALRLLGGRLAPGSQRLRLREHLALGRAGSLWLVEAAGRSLLLASGPRGIVLLADLTGAEPAPGVAAGAPAAAVPGAPAPGEAAGDGAAGPVAAAGFGAALEASLRRLRRLSGEGAADE